MFTRFTNALVIGVFAAASIWVADAAPAEGKKGPPGAGRRAPVPDDNAGFVAIFDGKTLNNWDGEPGFWRVEDGAIVGQTTP